MRRAFVALALLLTGCTALQVKTIGSPEGPAVRSNEFVAMVIRKQEPYIPSLHRDPRNDRFGYSLLLTPLDGGGRKRLVPLKGSGDKVQLLGVDGHILWILANELVAYDLRAHRLIEHEALRRRNPAMERLWQQARYDFGGGHLRVVASDFTFGFQMDPETLTGSSTTELRMPGRLPESPVSYLRDDGALDVWLGLRTEDKGSESRRRYRIHRVANARSASPVAGPQYLAAAFLRESRDGGALRLSNPDGLVLTYQSGPWPNGTLTLARVGASGEPAWRADTRIADVEQYLPGTGKIVVLGKGPRIPDKVPEPLLSIIDTATGAVSTSVLWQRD